MIYDITKSTCPVEMPHLGRGLEALSLLLSPTSKDMHPVLFPMEFPIWGAHISDAEFQYPSGQWLELCGQQAVQVAASADNKGQLGLMVEGANRDYRAEDEAEMKKYNQYARNYKKRSQTKDRPDEVFPLLHILPANTTLPGFLRAQMKAQENGGITTFIDVKEIEQLDALCGSHKKVSEMCRLIYDREIYSALRATVDGVSGICLLRTNITASATPGRARNFFKNNLHDGTLGRMVFSYKPRSSRSGRIPRLGNKLDEDFYEQMDKYLSRLANCKGRYVIKPLNKLIQSISDDLAEFADLTDNDTLWSYGKRSLISAWKAGCIMWALNEQSWSRGMADAVEYLVWHDLWSKWQVMGDLLKEGDTSTKEVAKSGPANMLDALVGTTFNEQQLDALREKLGKPTGAATKKQLSVWSARGLIEYSNQTGLYTKTDKYLKGKQ